MQDVIDLVARSATRLTANLAGRIHGPMGLRLVLQPLMAALFALRDGARDAREGRPPYFWSLFTSPGHRRELLREGWKSVGKIFVFAVALDAIYQCITVRWFYPGEALAVATCLALVPYLVLRGPFNRIKRWR